MKAMRRVIQRLPFAADTDWGPRPPRVPGMPTVPAVECSTPADATLATRKLQLDGAQKEVCL
jgi:hypothetical protein